MLGLQLNVTGDTAVKFGGLPPGKILAVNVALHPLAPVIKYVCVPTLTLLIVYGVVTFVAIVLVPSAMV